MLGSIAKTHRGHSRQHKIRQQLSRTISHRRTGLAEIADRCVQTVVGQGVDRRLDIRPIDFTELDLIHGEVACEQTDRSLIFGAAIPRPCRDA